MTQKTYIDDKGEAKSLDPAFFKKARRGRPSMEEAERKQRVTIMLDREVIDYFKKDGRGWQTRANAALRKAAGI